MSPRFHRAARSRRGLTLVELVLSAGLLAILLAAVFQLVRQFMGVWEKSEVRRMQVEEATGVSELLAADLVALEPGPRGDLLAEWVFFDHDLNGTAETKWPRVRMVRHASPAELARLQAGEQADARLAGEGFDIRMLRLRVGFGGLDVRIHVCRKEKGTGARAPVPL